MKVTPTLSKTLLFSSSNNPAVTVANLYRQAKLFHRMRVLSNSFPTPTVLFT